MLDETEMIDDQDDWLCHAYPPDCGPPAGIYFEAVPIWTGMTHRELAAQLGAEYGCGFAWGFERGIIMAMLRPEWVQGFYFKLREHYTTTHIDEDLTSWERHAEETARAIPVSIYDDKGIRPTVASGTKQQLSQGRRK